MSSLAPSKRIEHLMALQKETHQEARKFSQQMALEDRRDLRSGTQEDARERRTQQTIDAAAARQERALEGRGRLTPTQERSNIEIDAARERIAMMDPAEIRRRSNKATNTGRENPDYDPSIARAAALAARRKVGDDGWFDSRQGQQPAAPKSEPVQSRFATDAAMKGYRMGKRTSKGFEVLDASGKLLGHYD